MLTPERRAEIEGIIPYSLIHDEWEAIVNELMAEIDRTHSELRTLALGHGLISSSERDRQHWRILEKYHPNPPKYQKGYI
jgi:hypothetical protein